LWIKTRYIFSHLQASIQNRPKFKVVCLNSVQRCLTSCKLSTQTDCEIVLKKVLRLWESISKIIIKKERFWFPFSNFYSKFLLRRIFLVTEASFPPTQPRCAAKETSSTWRRIAPSIADENPSTIIYEDKFWWEENLRIDRETREKASQQVRYFKPFKTYDFHDKS
jgi:hypothetical protein